MDQSNKQSSISKTYKVIPILSFQKADIFILIAVLALGMLIPFIIRFALNHQSMNVEDQRTAVLTIAGEQVWGILLTSEEQDNVFFDFNDDGIDIVVGYNGISVWFEASNCPDQTCVRMGGVSNPRQVAVCVPNRAMLSVTSSHSSSREVRDLDISEDADIVAGRIGG